MHRSFALRLSLLFLPVAILVGGMAWLGYGIESARRHSDHGTRERARLLAGTITIAAGLESVRGDLRYLAGHEALLKVLEGGDAQALRHTARDWLQFSRSKPVYDQIRWLDEEGMERLRINLGQGSPAVVPPAELQTKADRYYFREAMALEPGEVFVSPLDLNVENGQIERPFKPTLRLATPLRDAHGRKRGIVVLNYLGAPLLALYAGAASNHMNQAWLLNSEGYWLKGTDPADEWGFMFGRSDRALPARHPEAWKRMSGRDQGQFTTAEGLWTFRAFRPFQDGAAPTATTRTKANPPLLMAVSLVPSPLFEKGLREFGTILGGSAFLALSLWLLGSWRLVRARIAEETLRTSLEERVAQRTRTLDEKNLELTESIAEQRRIMAESLRLWEAIDQAAESVMITDTAGIIQYVNPAFTTITGYSSQEAVGSPPSLLKSGRHEPAFYREIWDTLLTNRVWKGRITNRRKDGKLITADTTISPVLDERGEILNFVSVSQDVTGELELELQFRQAQKMDAIGRLAGGVAHDFNNLLVPILVNCDLILGRPDLDADTARSVGQIAEAGERAKRIVQQLLAFSRKQTLVLEPTDLNQVVTRFNSLLRRIIREDIEIRTQLDERLPPVVADGGQMEQVIMNLAVNAQDAMPQGGLLILATGLADLDETYTRTHPGVSPGRYAMLSVSDTGMGMDPETCQKIFEPFFTTKEKAKGTGLGLSTVFGIVQQHKGSIWAYSEPGHGSVFKVYLPMAEGAVPAPAHPSPPTNFRGTETILVVEDDDGVRDLAARILEGQGYSVLTARDGREALDLVAEVGPAIQLLLADVILPGMNGRELYRRAAERSPDLKILYMSGYTDSVIGNHGVLEGGTHFLQKPFSIGSLLAKVREALEA
ncbi:MAG TPA: ATP-binding protein [Geothrix sp.]|nr:ATP-binding protein [Geothrix sp.]